MRQDGDPMIFIARIRRALYLLFVGSMRGEIACNSFDNRGLYELSSVTPRGENKRVWWKR